MLIKPIKTRIFREGENLFAFITDYFRKIPEKSVIAVTSKIVALAEKRTAIVENEETRKKLIRRESKLVVPTKYHILTVSKDGTVMTSAGIDASNANGKLILLPRDAFESARFLRSKLRKRYGVKNLGVLITDSRKMPLRRGIMGAAIGYAGFCGINDYRGMPDIFGRKLKFSRVNVADSLAAATVLVIGEGDEVEFRRLNAESLDLPDDSFDLVCGTGILHHLDLDRAYAEIVRTLRPDGSAVFIEPLGHNPLINRFRRKTPTLRTEDEHPLRAEDLELARRYFDEVDWRAFHLLSLGAVPLRRLPGFGSIVRGLDAADRLLFRVAPPLAKHAWQAVLLFAGPRKT